jgi:hypothetical protein
MLGDPSAGAAAGRWFPSHLSLRNGAASVEKHVHRAGPQGQCGSDRHGVRHHAAREQNCMAMQLKQAGTSLASLTLPIAYGA